MTRLDLTPEQHRDLYDLLAYVLRPQRAREGSSLTPLLDQLKAQAKNAFCSNCLAEDVYAQGECEPCYRYRRRTGNPRPEHLARAS